MKKTRTIEQIITDNLNTTENLKRISSDPTVGETEFNSTIKKAIDTTKETIAECQEMLNNKTLTPTKRHAITLVHDGAESLFRTLCQDYPELASGCACVNK
jgi:hypothetical protein